MHKSYGDGFFINTLYGVRMIADSITVKIPLMDAWTKVYDVLTFDRKNAAEKKKAIF